MHGVAHKIHPATDNASNDKSHRKKWEIHFRFYKLMKKLLPSAGVTPAPAAVVAPAPSVLATSTSAGTTPRFGSNERNARIIAEMTSETLE